MKTIRVNAEKPYDVCIGTDILSLTGTLLRERRSPCRVALVCDINTAPIFHEEIEKSLRSQGFETYRYILSVCENSKRLSSAEEVLNFFAGSHLTRSDCVVAFGGGITGDLVGFCAAVYLRGVDYIQLPSTLLAAVDSSVGGKTAVDLTFGKNLVGAFRQPLFTLCDCRCFDTLPESVFMDGIAEVIKYGVIADPELFERVSAGFPDDETECIVARCAEIKADFVARDEFDCGERHLLNFGHTFAHAVESCSGYSIGHGHAVAIGMAMAARAGKRLGISDSEVGWKIERALLRNDLSVACPYPADAVAQAMLSDKKRQGDEITLVLPRGIGLCEPHILPVSALRTLL